MVKREPIDPIVVEDPDSPIESRTKTAPRPKLGHRIEIDLDDADSLADFLVTVAELVRRRKRLVIIVE